MFKKSLSIFLCLLMIVSMVPFGGLSAAAEENELPEGYTGIYSIEDLYSIRYALAGKYILMNDLDLTEATATGGDWDGGYGWTPIGDSSSLAFTGDFDGNGHSIKGMRITGGTTDYTGLFGYVKGSIHDLKLSDVNISSSKTNVGGIAGYLYNGNISRVSVSGSISGSGSYVGGIVGYATTGSSDTYASVLISESFNKASVKNTYTGNYTIYAGGICAYIRYGTISDCYNKGTISGSSTNAYIGGICGGDTSYDNRIYIYRCINEGQISATGCKSAIGYVFSVKNSYYLSGTAGCGRYNSSDSPTTSVKLTEAQMKLKSVFGYLDFENVWFIDTDSGINHPQLTNNPEAVAEIISINSPATKTTYYHHEPLDISGLTLNVKYEGNDNIAVKTPTLVNVSGYDPDKLGEQTVTVSYYNKTATYTVEVIPLPVDSISLNITEKTLDKGEKLHLTASITPENATYKTVEWSSDDDDIATVDENGLVTATGRGMAVITAKTPEGKKAYCEVNVLVPAEEITLDKTEITLNKGETASVTAEMTPANTTDTFSFSSNNNSVATVDEYGVITAVSKGEAVISATTSRGVKTTCKVVVKLPADSVALDVTEKEIVLNESAVIKAVMNPVDSTDEISWTSSDETVAKVTQAGKVTALKIGTAVITATTTSGKTAACTVNVVVPATSIRLSSSVVNMNIGDNSVISATLTPNNTTDTYEWSTSDEEIVLVDSGNLYALSAGKATVTVETQRGVKATCTVFVKEATPQAKIDRNNKVIFNLVPNASYTIDGARYSADSNGKIAIIEEWSDTTLEIVKTNAVAMCNSASQSLSVGHVHFYHPSVVKPTCTEDGYTINSCVCGEKYNDSFVSSLGHNIITDKAVAATCTKTGLTEGSHCSRCNAVLVKQNVTEALGHSEVIDNSVEPTCTKTGLTQGKHCSRCGETLVAQTTIGAKGHSFGSWTVIKKSTCKEEGSQERICTVCKAKETQSIAKLTTHTNKTTTTKATVTANGSIVTKCTVCGKVSKTVTIAYPKTIKLSSTSIAYDGKAKTPTVTVTDSTGNALKKDTDYTVKYASGRKNIGEYKVTVTFKGNYSGTKTLSFQIVPKGTEISSVSAASQAFTANWKKQATQTTGYQLQYSTNSDLSSAKTVTVKKNTTVSQTVSKLKGNAKYYVRVRTYKTVDGTNYYSAWSAKKSVTTKPAVGITLNTSSETLYVGGTKTLSYSTYPTNVTVTWKSSDTSVAKVSSSGKVTAVKKGTATITASFKNGGKTYKATATVTVKNPSIKLNKTSATVTVKSSITLSATATPSSASVTWKSSDTSVAKVSSSGKVTGVKAGTATITASFSYGGKTYKATCKVTVKKESDKDRYNKVIDYIKKNGDIKYVFEDDGIQYATIISEKDGALNFYILQTKDNYIYYDSLVSYKYGDTYAVEVGGTEMGDQEIFYFDTKIPVKEFDSYYSLTYHIKYLSAYENAKDGQLKVHDNLVNAGFIFWNAQLKDLFGFGMKEIGFSSWY